MEYDVDTADLDAETAKIAALKAKRIEVARRAQREREKEAAKILIDSTPTKNAVKNHETPLPEKPKQPVFQPKPEAKVQELPSVPSKPAPSSMASSLAALRKYASGSSMPKAEVARSSSFTTRPEAGPSRKRPTSEDEDELEVEPPPRQDDLTVMQNLVPGPKEFGRDPEGENEWLHLEPNSRFRLQKRILPHATLQEHLYGRYYLSPSQLYSVIRLSRDGATYDVPVEGDWITIAVVAERSDIRVSGAKEEIHSDDDEEDETGNKKVKQGDKPKDKETRSKEQWKKRRGPRKYINLRMCSLPTKRPGTSESSGGDALLQLLLFESDATVHSVADGEKKYRGGSGGAYEKWCNLTAGCVVAILNPRVLRPLKSGPHAPHPLTLPLALNPTSADSVILIGHARDLGQCNATQKDGNRCKTWIDMRQSPVCEYHIHQTIQRGRNSRAEFTASTSGFGLASRPVGGKGGKDEYDPKRKFGLLPAGPMAAPRSQDNGGGGVTYVVGGNPVNMRRTDGGLRSFGDEKLSEKLGRSRAERKKRKLEAEQADQVLKDLLGKDGGGGMTTGGKYLAQVEKANAARVAESDKAKGKDKGKGKADQKDKGKEGEDVDPKRVFSAGAIRKIGFDPTARRGERDGEETQKRLDAIASLKEVTDRPLKLSRPKDLSRSNVRAPPGTESTVSDEVTPDYHLDFIDLD